MVYVKPETPYIKLLKPFLDKKKVRNSTWLSTDVQRLAADEWGVDDTVVRDIFDPLDKWFTDNVPSINSRYPKTWSPSTKIARLVRNILLSVRFTRLIGDLLLMNRAGRARR
jgi:hypothetical protein